VPTRVTDLTTLLAPAGPQLTWTVAINCGFFFTTTLMETGDASAGIQKIKDKLWPTLKVNWVVWPVLQGINLSVVPLQYRILYINFCSIFWSAYLSNMASSPVPGQAVLTAAEQNK
jgi:hypothetical protein